MFVSSRRFNTLVSAIQSLGHVVDTISRETRIVHIMADSALKGLVALQTQDTALKQAVQQAISGIQALQGQVAQLQAAGSEDDQVSAIANDMQASISSLSAAFVQAATTGASATITDPQTSTVADTVAGQAVAQTPATATTPAVEQQAVDQHDKEVEQANS